MYTYMLKIALLFCMKIPKVIFKKIILHQAPFCYVSIGCQVKYLSGRKKMLVDQVSKAFRSNEVLNFLNISKNYIKVVQALLPCKNRTFKNCCYVDKITMFCFVKQGSIGAHFIPY